MKTNRKTIQNYYFFKHSKNILLLLLSLLSVIIVHTVDYEKNDFSLNNMEQILFYQSYKFTNRLKEGVVTLAKLGHIASSPNSNYNAIIFPH